MKKVLLLQLSIMLGFSKLTAQDIRLGPTAGYTQWK
jgi:hypothetical protein